MFCTMQVLQFKFKHTLPLLKCIAFERTRYFMCECNIIADNPLVQLGHYAVWM